MAGRRDGFKVVVYERPGVDGPRWSWCLFDKSTEEPLCRSPKPCGSKRSARRQAFRFLSVVGIGGARVEVRAE